MIRLKTPACPTKRFIHLYQQTLPLTRQIVKEPIIARTRDGIAVLKGEINQDEKRGVDTERKQAELKQLEKKEQRAISFQASILGEAHNTMKSAADTADTGTNAKTWGNAKSNAFFNAVNISQRETQAAQQDFYVSFG